MSFTQQYVSLIFIVVLNAVTLFLVMSEYLRVQRPFLRATIVAQGAALAWHLSTVWMVLVGPSTLANLASASSTWMFSLGFLAAVLTILQSRPPRSMLVASGMATVLMGLLAVAGVAPFGTLLWLASALVMLLTPLLALRAQLPGLRAALVIIQLCIAACFGIGFVLLMMGRPELGGTLYLVNALLIPAATQVFFQHALRLSTDEMRSSEERFRELFGSLHDTYFWLAGDGCIDTVSPSIHQFGHQPDALTGRLLSNLFTDPEQAEEQLRIAAATGRAGFQATLCRPDGEARECEVSIQAVASPGETHFSGTIRDITERNQLERQFLDAQRRESLGVLAGGVAHDFNNLLQGITSHAEFLRDAQLSGSERTSSLQAILGGAATASTLCNRLLHYTGKAQLKLQPMRVADTLEELVQMLPGGSHAPRVELEVQDADQVVDADETLIRQVILNLVQNALDASPPDTPVKVLLHTASGPQTRLPGARALGGDPMDQPCACIDVIDAGCGIQPEQLEKIFDPFYSTKDDGHGLGLSAVLGIIRRHRGNIAVRSAPGKGAHFRITLPLSCQVVPQSTSAAPAAEHAGGELVLVVDDSDAIRDVTAQSLGLHGYRVLQARDGADALQLFRARANEIDLVLSDINMPALDGFGLLRAIRETSDVPVILMSGFYTDLDDKQVTEDRVAFLPKPFLQKALVAQLAASLRDPHQDPAPTPKSRVG